MWNPKLPNRGEEAPCIDIEANREYYRQNAAGYDSDEQPFVHQGAFLERLLSRFADCRPGIHVLDFGAGTGSSTLTLVKLFPSARIVGLDVSPEMLNIASRKCPKALFMVFDGKHIPFESQRFDFILVSSVLHHILDFEGVISEISRCCSMDGRVVITQEPNPPVNRLVNRARSLLSRNVPELLRRAEGYQFSKEGGISPQKLIDILMADGFRCELIYNNDALLDCLLKRHFAIYRLMKLACRSRLFPLHLSYNVLAERGLSKHES